MRVLHVAECIGGVDRYLRCLLKYSKNENILILSQLFQKEVYDNLASHVEIMHMTHGIGISAITEAKELRGRIKKNNPDLVYAHSSIAGAITRIACIGLNIKVVYNPHGWSFNMEGRNKKLFAALERLMAHFCDVIVCISEAEKVSALREKICKEDKLRVIENGIDIEGYKLDEVNIPENVIVVGMVGRICRQKAPDVFIKMAMEVHNEISNSFFVIVGDVLEGREEERKEIENLAKKCGIDLLITGWVDNPLSYVSRFDVGCLLSRWEGFGLVIPEYMLAGVPVVATKVDAIPFLIEDGVNGMLVEKDDWHGAAMKVVELERNEEKRNIIVSNAMKTVKERFDARRMANECEKLYEDLVN